MASLFTSSAEQSPVSPVAGASALVCDLAPTALLAMDGPDAAVFLNGQLSCDVMSFDAGACQYASYNSPAGRVLATMVLWRDAAEAASNGFRVLLAGDIAESIRKRLTMFVLRSKVSIRDVSSETARFGVGGHAAHDALAAALGAAPAAFHVTRTDGSVILGLPGGRFVVVADREQGNSVQGKLRQHGSAAEFGTWQWLTIRAGVPVITAATQDKFVPQMIN